VVVLFFSLVTSQTTPREKAGLLALFNNTGGSSWTNTWNILSDPCINNWFGIKCRAFGSNQWNIWSLVLQGNNLIGPLPTEIGLLDQLQFLFLSGNQIQGTLPAQIGDLKQLVQLGLDKNAISGGFPNTMQGLGGLQIIYAQDNQFSGPIDVLGRLTGIQYLWLSRNKLIGTLPPQIGNVFTLQQVGVDSNQLTGTVPSGFGTRQALFQAFYGQNNKFTGLFPMNLCPTATCDLSGNTFACPLPNPTCCHVTTCVPAPPPPPTE